MLKPFKVIIGLQDVERYLTFQEAFREFSAKVKEVATNGMSLPCLETTCHIEYCGIFGQESPCLMNFYQAGDFARQIGILTKDGQLQEFRGIILPSEMAEAFTQAMDENVKATPQYAGEFSR